MYCIVWALQVLTPLQPLPLSPRYNLVFKCPSIPLSYILCITVVIPFQPLNVVFLYDDDDNNHKDNHDKDNNNKKDHNKYDLKKNNQKKRKQNGVCAIIRWSSGVPYARFLNIKVKLHR